MNLVEKHTFIAHGVEIGMVDVVVFEAAVVEYVLVDVGVVDVVLADVGVVEAVLVEGCVVDAVLVEVGVVEVGVVEVVVAEVIKVEYIELEVVVGISVDDGDVEVTKQVQADEILDEELEHWKATSERVGPNPWVNVYALQKAELDAGA